MSSENKLHPNELDPIVTLDGNDYNVTECIGWKSGYSSGSWIGDVRFMDKDSFEITKLELSANRIDAYKEFCVFTDKYLECAFLVSRQLQKFRNQGQQV